MMTARHLADARWPSAYRVSEELTCCTGQFQSTCELRAFLQPYSQMKIKNGTYIFQMLYFVTILLQYTQVYTK